MRHLWLPAVLLFGATFLLYSPLGRYQFINYDDQLYVTENYVVQQGLTLRGAKWAFTAITASNWHPVTMLSHMLDCELFGLNPSGHHYTNLLLHSLNAALLFLFLAYLTGKVGRSFAASALFAFHPIATESVMWIAERKNLLCTLFFILALAAYVGYARTGGWKRYLLVTVLYLVALMSKPMVVTFPFVLLLLDYWPLCRWQPLRSTASAGISEGARLAHVPFAKLVLEKLPWFALSLGESLVTLYVQHREGAVTAGYVPFWGRFGNAVLSYGRYLWKIVVPLKLCIFYPHPKLALPWTQVALSAAVLGLITLLVLGFRAHRYLAVGWLWFLGTLVPVIGVVQAGSQAMADRYAYIPFIGIFVAVVWAASEMLDRRQVARKLVVVSVCLVLVVLGWRTRVQAAYWQNSTTLFSHALEVAPDSAVAHVNLSMALAEQGFAEEAVRHIRAALVINPRDPVALQSLALYHIHEGNTVEALDELNNAAALAKYPFLQERIHMTLGALYSKSGDMEKAKSEYAQAIRLQPEDYKPYLNLAVHLYLEGKYDQALEKLKQSISAFPTSTAYYYQGEVLVSEGKLREAEQSYRRALEISPKYDDARRALGELLTRVKPTGVQPR